MEVGLRHLIRQRNPFQRRGNRTVGEFSAVKLTIEENRETIKRYGHIKPAPFWGSVSCSARCPGTVRTCTLERGHIGPHVAHGTFRKVLAVWDQGIKAGKSDVKPRRAVGPIARRRSRDRGLVAALKAFWGRVLRRDHFIEEAFLLVLAVAMVGFAIDWALRILGLH
jgi:hypothetical protein